MMIRLLICAFVIRALVAAFGYNELAADPDSYARLAVNWSDSGTFGFEATDGAVTPTAFRPPLYPWLLSWFVVDGRLPHMAVAGLHLMLGLATVGLTYAIGRRLNLHYAWLAGLAVTCDPLLVRGAQLVMTETLATLMAVLVWWLALVVWPVDASRHGNDSRRCLRQWLALLGCSLMLGLSILARSTAAAWGLLCLASLLCVGGATRLQRGRDMALAALGILVCLAPWTLRNQLQLGKPIWATTHGGYTLLLANNPSLYDHFAQRGPSRGWDPQSFHNAWGARFADGNAAQMSTRSYWLRSQAGQPAILGESQPQFNEVNDDRLAYRAALATIARQPEMFALSCLYRTGWLWALAPYDREPGWSEFLIGAWYAWLYVLAALGLWSVARTGTYRGWLIGLCLVGSLTAVHAVFWSNMRMRTPAMPCVILLGASGLQFLPRRINTSPRTMSKPPAT